MTEKDNNLINNKTSFESMPGYFTGVYTKIGNNVRARAELLKEIAFSDMLANLENAKQVLMNGPSVQSKVQKGSNGLPLLASVMEEVGTYGLIFAGGLQSCQYFKKSSPPPKFFNA